MDCWADLIFARHPVCQFSVIFQDGRFSVSIAPKTTVSNYGFGFIFALYGLAQYVFG